MWFRKPKPYIEFWSTEKGIDDIMPPIPALQCLPEWFKSMPTTIKDDSVNFGVGSGSIETAKQCPAFVEMFKTAYVMRLWTDIRITINEDTSYYVESADKRFEFTNHGHRQFTEFMPDDKKYSMILKAVSPWRVRTPKGYSVMQLPMLYHYDSRFESLSGAFHSDIHHDNSQQLGFFGYGTFEIERGTPLSMLVPFKREKIKHRVLPFTDKLYTITNRSYLWWAGRFKHGYRQHRNLAKGENND